MSKTTAGFVAAALVAAGVVFCLACGAGAAEAAPADPPAGKPASCPTTRPGITLGVCLIEARSAWGTVLAKSIQDEAGKLDIAVRLSASARPEDQVDAFRGLVKQRVDAIALQPVVEAGWSGPLKEAKEAHVPVIFLERVSPSEDPSLYATCVANDFAEQGRVAGAWLAKATGGKARIAEIGGVPRSPPAIGRGTGFAGVIKDHPGMVIAASRASDFSRPGGKQAMDALLAMPECKDITAVFVHNDDMAFGAIQALEQAGRKPGKDVLVVSIDGMAEAIRAVRDGKLSCTVEHSPLFGPELFDAVRAVLNAEPLKKRTIVKSRAFTQANADLAKPKY